MKKICIEDYIMYAFVPLFVPLTLKSFSCKNVKVVIVLHDKWLNSLFGKALKEQFDILGNSLIQY